MVSCSGESVLDWQKTETRRIVRTSCDHGDRKETENRAQERDVSVRLPPKMESPPTSRLRSEPRGLSFIGWTLRNTSHKSKNQPVRDDQLNRRVNDTVFCSSHRGNRTPHLPLATTQDARGPVDRGQGQYIKAQHSS